MRRAELTPTQKELLKILKKSVHGEMYDGDGKDVDFAELHHLSVLHHISAIIFDTVRKEFAQNFDFVREAAFWRKEVKRDVFLQMRKTDYFLQTYKELCSIGVRPLVVKGILCRELYPDPDYRPSGDEDLLIRIEDFRKCDRFLKKSGYLREELEIKKIPQEVSYFHPQTGVYLELHTGLFLEESNAYGYLNREFRNVFKRYSSEMIQGVKIYTLNPSDHFFYLICHSFKHFLHSGFGIRQVCDMMLFAEHYGRKINWKETDKKLEKLGMLVFWKNLEAIALEYLGFDRIKACMPETVKKVDIDFEDLLLDLLNSGVYGGSSMERRHSANITLQAAAEGRKNTAASIRASLFPSRDYMERNYVWLKKAPYLISAAWFLRVAEYTKYYMKTHKVGQREVSLEIGMERVELLRKYGVIK